MKVKLTRTLILALVITISLFILAFYPRKDDLYGLNGEGVQIAANELSPRIYHEVKYENHTISLHEPMVEDPDIILQEYIQELFPDNYSLIESFSTGRFYKSINKKTLSIQDKIYYRIYTFSNNNTTSEPQYFTVLDLRFLEPIKTTTSYSELTIQMTNDYLRPISPATGKLYTRNTPKTEWLLKYDVTPLEYGTSISLNGDQLKNNDDYLRILLSFPSVSNPETQYEYAKYEVLFTNSKNISFFLLLAFALVLVKSILGVWRNYKARNAKKLVIYGVILILAVSFLLIYLIL